MRVARLVLPLVAAAVLVQAEHAAGQDVDFQLLRYDDDLTLSRSQADAGDPTLKAWRVDELGWLSLGGEIRVRVERASAPSLGRISPDADSYGFHRVLVHADVQTKGVRLFVQLGAFAAPGKDQAAPPAENAIDIQQAFVDIAASQGTSRFTARIGRQEVALGSQRLIGLRDGPNQRLNFDGVKLAYRHGNLKADILLLQPVEQRPGAFDDRTAHRSSLTGVYSTLATGAQSGAIDIYLLRYQRPRGAFASVAGPEDRWSGGIRVSGRKGILDWDAEITVQSGSLGPESIRAWGVASDTGMTFRPGDWEVRVGTKIDIASGDRRRGDGELNTANALYPKLPYLGSAAAFTPANMVDIHPEVTMSHGKVAVTLGYQAIWRQTKQDAVYVAPLIPLEGTAGRGSRFTAHQLTLDTVWRLSPSLRVDAAVAWVDISRSLRRLGAKNTAFAYTAVTWRY